MSDLRKMARDAGFNTEFDDYVIDHWARFEKFAELIISEFFISEALSQSKPIPMENIGQYTVPCEVRNEGENK